MENLFDASHKTLLLGRRYRGDGAVFKFNLEKNLYRLHTELINKTYSHGKYTKFKIYDPKERLVLAAPIKDRVVHHAVHDVLEPIIDRKFIYDSYACRKDKGTHKAIKRAQCFFNACDYGLHLDVKKYFPSIDILILKRLLEKYIEDQDTLWLLNIIIDSSFQPKKKQTDKNQLDLFLGYEAQTEEKGLPIGNLTSQFFANLYLNELDQYVKHTLKHRYYIRYMDDMLFLSSNKAELRLLERTIWEFCYENLMLEIKPSAGPIFYKRGLGFLGFRIFRNHLRLKSKNVKRFYSHYRNNLVKFRQGECNWDYLQDSINSWMVFASFGDTYKLRNKIMSEINIRNYTLLEEMNLFNS